MSNDLKIGGVFSFEHIRGGKVIDSWEKNNLVTSEGLNYTLGVAVKSGNVSTSWFVDLFKNNVSAVSNMSLATSNSTLNPITTSSVSNLTRPSWVLGNIVSGSVSNSESPAKFTFKADTSINGAFITNISPFTGVSGADSIILAISDFPTRSMQNTDILNITYALSMVSS